MHWYQRPSSTICDELEVNPKQGLTSGEAKKRLEASGPNILASKKKESLTSIFLRQLKSPLIYILVLASAIAGILGELVDALVILVVLILNSFVGAFQEGRARNSLEKLRSLTRHRALVLRDGNEELIASEEVVPGDILILNEGDRVVADARIIVDENLQTDEAVLTGEAYAVSKNSAVIRKEGLVVGDQKNMVFSGTAISSGHGIAVVVATGIESELGKISKELLETADVPLPLASKINKLTRFIVLAVVLICSAVLSIGLIRGVDTLELIYAVVGLSVSIIPEGLPVAVTIVLARGVWRMAKNKAIVRQMAAVEAMGNADVLLVDKTGTITTGEMRVCEIYGDGEKFEVTGNGYDPEGEIIGSSGAARDKLEELAGLCFLSLKASVVKQENDGWKPVGDSTEAAIAAFCLKTGVSREELEKEYKTVFANPFDSEKRYIEAEFKLGSEKRFVFVGAPDFIARDLKVDQLIRDTERLTAQGRRVVAIAVFGGSKESKKIIGSLLIAIDEEIRPEVNDAVGEAHRAGFKVVMMTGDFPITARTIAKKVGIYSEGDQVLTAEDVDKLSEDELSQKLKKTTVFARITPTHKLKIVRAFQKLGHVTAMTGDGVNDGPALQAANLGIGLGSGTQVAKDASDIVLTDDNFKTIIGAIAEGRLIYLTLKKVILYLFATSIGEVLVIAGALIIGLPLPVVAVQIIWLNFVTDGFFVVALASDKTRANLLSVTETKSDRLVDELMIQRMGVMGFGMLLATLPVFYYFISNNYELGYARTMALVILSITQWFNAFNVRSRFLSILATPLNNPYLIISFVIVFVMQILIVQTRFGNEVMHTVPLQIRDWILALAVSTVVIWVEEIRKLIVKARS